MCFCVPDGGYGGGGSGRGEGDESQPSKRIFTSTVYSVPNHANPWKINSFLFFLQFGRFRVNEIFHSNKFNTSVKKYLTVMHN
jgi:hypothetical protein